VDWFVKLLKDWLSLHPIRFPTFVSHPSCLVRHEVKLMSGVGGLKVLRG
jgi:hypothetical protein